MGNTLLKITMPSAPSVSIAPFDAQTIGLTDWDNDITVGGLTYRATRFALGDATSSQDFSQGKGGFALGNQIDHISLENGLDGGGLLSSYVDSGAIPLNGAIAQLLDETGAITVQTWVLCEKAVDGATLSFSLRTPGYMSTKLVRFPASRYDGAVDVGLAVGDAAVQGINATGRYKGVSVPTKAFGSQNALQIQDLSLPSYTGTPDVSSGTQSGPSVPHTSSHPYDKSGTSPNYYFSYIFNSLDLREQFIKTYCGDVDSSSPQYISPKSCLLVSDGSNSEVICTSDVNGLVTYNSATVIKRGSRVIGASTKYSVDVCPYSGGSVIASDASSIQLYFIKQDSPIASGASSLVGFQNKPSNFIEYGIVTPAGISFFENGIFRFMPTIQTESGFTSWSEIKNSKGFAFSLPTDELSQTVFSGTARSILTDKKATQQSTSGGLRWEINYSGTGGIGTNIIGYYRLPFVSLLKTTDIKIDINKVIVDPRFYYKSLIAPNGVSTVTECDVYFIDPFATSRIHTNSRLIENIRNLSGPDFTSGHMFDNLESLSTANSDFECAIQIETRYVTGNYEISIIQQIYGIVLWGRSTLAFGSNHAVVVPGNFPGTSNPTTTPVLAATQLASWLGLAPKLTGGITPSSGTWGEFIGAAPDEDDTTYGKQRLGDMMEEAWIYGQEANSTAKPPDLEVPEYPVLPPPSVDDLVTEPSWDYDYAGTSKQFTAAIKNVGESFDISKGDGYFWGGWQEKDACHVSTSPGSTVLAMCQLEDCLAVVCADGYLRCSYDGGVTWPYSLSLYGAASINGVALAGNGIMVAVQGKLNGTSCAYSTDAGRTWATIATFVGATIQGGWFDATSDRFWLCGKDSIGAAAVWYSTNAVTWTKISATGFVSVPAIIASGDNILIAGQDSAGMWLVANNTISSGESIWVEPNIPGQGWTAQPFLGLWDGFFRASIGTTLYSSSGLTTWTSFATPAPLQAFATDGKVVSALASESAGGNHVYYSRDQGATWRAVQISPEGATWASTGSMISIWDDNTKCFRLSGWGPTRIIALGDPSVLDIWHRCRASCLANSNTIATATYKTPGLYDSFELLRWLLDCKDGTDSEYQQARIDWITKGARFVTLRGRYSSIVDQLSVAAGLPITIPRKILTYSGNAANIPTTGIVSKATHHLSGDDKGLSEIEIIMPPL